MKKKTKIALCVILFAAFCAGAYIIDEIRHDPNYVISHFSRSIELDEKEEISFKSDKNSITGRNGIPVMHFRPAETSEYTFTVSDIQSTDGVYLKLAVTDRELSNYVSTDNHTGDEDTLSGTALLNADTDYFVIIEAEETEEYDSFEGSFILTVTKTVHDEGPEEITEGDTVRISVSPDKRSGLLFRPEETGFYRFDTMISGREKDLGSSEISSVTSGSGADINLYGGICYLTSGTDYYIWVETEMTEHKKAKVKVSCTAVVPETIDLPDSVSIKGETLIEYTAASTDPLAVWSSSDGDLQAAVYDQNGIPVSMDMDSGGAFSGNDKDFALVFYPEKGKKYYIYVSGDCNECEISSAVYTGDGTSLGPDSVS